MSQPTIGRRPPATTRAEVVELHEFTHWPARWIWPLFLGMLALQATAVLLPARDWPALLVLWPIVGAMMFVFTLSFHDASHGRMHPVGWANDMFGHMVGTFGWTPLNVYRYAHARHHAQLAREGDPELWPFNSPGVPRVLRVAAAVAEICFGFIYTPLLFLRSVLVGKLTPQERRLVIRGYLGCLLFWGAVLAVTYEFGLWRALLVGTIVPMWFSGILQTLNKYEQHLGLHGQTVLGLTRTVVDQSKSAEIISAAMLYNDYHGTHHRYAKIPYYHLPDATPYTLAGAREPVPVFPSIVSAFVDMLRCLWNPKAGPQWAERENCAEVGDSGIVSLPIEQPVFTGSYATERERADAAETSAGDSPTHVPPHQRVG